MMRDVKTCPVLREALRTQRLSGQVVVSLRRLRSKMKMCQDCQPGGCEELKKFHGLIHQAIAEITEEWNLEGVVEGLKVYRFKSWNR